MFRSANGDIVAEHSHDENGFFSFVYRAMQTGIDYVHVLMLTPCPETGCILAGPPEAQWVIRVVGPVDPYPVTMTMQRGLTAVVPTPALPWGTSLTTAQSRQVTITSVGSTYRWGVWVTGGGPTFPVRSTDGGADWTAAGPQLATDWAGGSLFYVSKVFAESPSAVVMVSNSVVDVSTDGGHQWYQYLHPNDNWTMAAQVVSGGGIGLRVRPANYAIYLPRASYAVYVLDVAEHTWRRVSQSLS